MSASSSLPRALQTPHYPAAQIIGALRILALALFALAAAGSSARAELLYATNGTAIIRFETINLGATTTVPVTGLQAGETLVDIDLRPANGLLYAIGSTSRLYLVSPITGTATQVGAAGSFTLNGTAFGMDFNPAPDRIRLVSNTEQSLRINPNDGTLAATDAALNPAGNIVSAAYNRNDLSPATPTTLFGIDSAAGTLVMIGGPDGTPSPNTGAVTTVGTLGLGTNLNEAVGFDVSATGIAYATITTSGVSRLYTINLKTGAATLLGPIGAGNTPFLGLAAAAVDTNILLYRQGSAVPGEPAGTVFADFGLPALDDARLGFQATIVKEGVRTGVVIGGTGPAVLLRVGDPAPGTSANFAGFTDAVFGGAHYAVLAKLGPATGISPANNEGIWSDANGTLQLVAQKGGPAPDANDATYLSFLTFALPGSGGPAFIAKLRPGTGSAGNKVTAASDLGLWRESSGTTRLIIREGMPITIGMTSRTVKSFQALSLVPGSEDQRRSHRSNGDLIIVATFTDGVQAILRNPIGMTTLEAQVVTNAAVSASPGGILQQIGIPAASSDGTAFLGLLAPSDSISAANDTVVFHRNLVSAPSGVTQESSIAPGVDNAAFASFGPPIAAPGSATIFQGTLRKGSGIPRVRPDNDTGLWAKFGGSLELIARESYAAAGTPGGFGKFLSLAVDQDAMPVRALAFTALLQNGAGGVRPTNNLGLWARDAAGNILLIRRTGDSFDFGAGEIGVVNKIDALKASPRSAGQGRAQNNLGQIIYRATLGKTGQAIFRAQLP